MTSLRQPGVLGWLLVAICFVIGYFNGVPDAADPPVPAPSAFALFFVPAAFVFGYGAVPLLARAMTRNSSLDWRTYLWLFSGLALLALQVAAFGSSLLWGAPNWWYLFNAACPLGISLALAFPVDPLESGRNLL